MSSRKAFQPNSSNLIRTVSVELVLTLLIVIGLTGSIPPALASGGMPSDIFDLNSVAWASVRNYSSAAFSDYFDEMVDQGYMLIDYEVTAIDGQQRVSGVFQINVDGRAWVAFRNLTSDQFSEKWNQYKKAGYRLIEQDGYVLNGQLLYSLIMIENKEGLDWASRRNLTSAQFAEEFDVYKDRFIPVDVEAYPAGNATLYAITWVENVENLDWIERRNLTSAQFSEEFQQNKTNFRVHDIEAYVRDGNQNYAAIWIENKNGRAWKELRDMTVQQYADAWQANWDAGYRVTDFEVYDTPDGQKRYAAVWRQNTIRPGWQHKEDVDNLLEEAMEVFDIPGMSVAVAKGNTWLYLRGLGYADIDDGRKASSKTIYRLASVSKAVSGVMALDLEERGMIDLNEDTRTYVPTMPAHHTHEVWQTVTNRAGIGHYGAYDDFLLTMYEHFDTALEAAQLFWDEPLLYAPGTDTLYSTPAYTLFGAAVEGAVGDPIDTVVREELSERYNLPTLRAEDRSQANSNRASLYGWDEDLGQNFEWTDVDDTSQKVNGGGMEASAFDLARLGTKLLNGSILTEASLNTLWTPPDGLSNYAYGWEVATQECSALVGKPGGQPGANAYLRIYPDFDITIVVLTNRWQGGHSAADISREIGQYMLEAECNAEPDVVQFRGIEHSSLGSARITPESGSLMVSNIGFRERDGVLIDLDASRSWQADMSFEYSPIGVAKFTAQADGRDLATLKLFEKDDALEIAPDFAGRDYQVMYLNGEETVGKTTRLAGTSAAHFNWDEIKCLLSGGESFICKLKVEYGPDQPGGGSAWSLALAEPVSMDLPGGPSFVDRIELIEALDGRADASEATRLTSMQLVFAHLNSVVIGDETAVADEDFVVYLPFVSKPPTHLFEEPEAPPTDIKLSWEGVDTPDTVMEIGDESLHLTIENVDTVRLKARVTVEISADGNRAHRLYESVSLEPGQKKNLEVSLAAVDVDLRSLKFAGRLEAWAEVRDAENERLGEFAARTLYFHPSTEGTTLLYGLSAYQERFGAGNFRGMPLPELENVLRDGRERLEAAGVRGVDLRLANVSTPKIGPPPEEMAHLVAAPNPLQRRFCIWVDAEAYRDASPKFYHGVEYDYGEDFGRDVVALARALVVVYDSAGAIFAGHTGANGCTPWVQTNDTGGFTVYYMPWYRDDDNSVLMYVTDYEQDYGVPLYVFEDVDPYWPTAILFVDWLNRPLTIYGAASASVERFPGGYDDVTYEISWGTPGNGGTATDYNQGIPRVKIDENGFAFCPRVRRLCQGALLPDMVDSPIMPCDL